MSRAAHAILLASGSMPLLNEALCAEAAPRPPWGRPARPGVDSAGGAPVVPRPCRGPFTTALPGIDQLLQACYPQGAHACLRLASPVTPSKTSTSHFLSEKVTCPSATQRPQKPGTRVLLSPCLVACLPRTCRFLLPTFWRNFYIANSVPSCKLCAIGPVQPGLVWRRGATRTPNMFVWRRGATRTPNMLGLGLFYVAAVEDAVSWLVSEIGHQLVCFPPEWNEQLKVDERLFSVDQLPRGMASFVAKRTN